MIVFVSVWTNLVSGASYLNLFTHVVMAKKACCVVLCQCCLVVYCFYFEILLSSCFR